MFGVGMGPNEGEKGATNSLQGYSGFAGSQGENLLGNSSAFLNALMSGDSTKISQLLAPQISAVQGQGNQAKKTLSEFGTRSGGVTSQAGMIDDKSRSTINDMIASLTGSAIGQGASLGSNLLNMGMQGTQGVFDMQKIMHDQNSAKWNDIFKSAAQFAAAPFTGGASLGMGKFSIPKFGGIGAITSSTDGGSYDSESAYGKG